MASIVMIIVGCWPYVPNFLAVQNPENWMTYSSSMCCSDKYVECPQAWPWNCIVGTNWTICSQQQQQQRRRLQKEIAGRRSVLNRAFRCEGTSHVPAFWLMHLGDDARHHSLPMTGFACLHVI